jgi:hypothetical protein
MLMSETMKPTRWPEPSFFENRLKLPREELLKYANKYIAWSYDGAHIVDSDDDSGALYDRLKSAGYDMGRTVIGFVEIFFGKL